MAHAIDPKHPAATGQYINLGDYYDLTALSGETENIIDINRRYKSLYSSAYDLINSAYLLNKSAFSPYTKAANAIAQKRAKSIISREFKRKKTGLGKTTNRFLDAVTCKGYVFLDETISSLAERVYAVDNDFGFSHLLLSPIAAAAHENGYDIIICRSPVSPDKINHLIIPELSLAFVSQNSNTFHFQNPYRHIRLDASAERDIDKCTRRKIKHCRKTYALIMEDAISSLADAKNLHDDLEKIYNPHVDFESIYSLAEHYSETLLK